MQRPAHLLRRLDGRAQGRGDHGRGGRLAGEAAIRRSNDVSGVRLAGAPFGQTPNTCASTCIPNGLSSYYDVPGLCGAD